MICIYDKDNAYFDNNDLAVLNEAQECIIKEKLNGEYELELSYPLYTKKSEFIEIFNIIKANGQLFRIYYTERDSSLNQVRANARHIFYDLIFYVVESAKISNKYCKAALETVLSSAGANSKYTVNSNINYANTFNISMKNAAETIFEICEKYNGEIIRDNFNITINYSKGKNNNFEIRYGKNAVGIRQRLDADNVVSKIYPVGENNLTLPEKYISYGEPDEEVILPNFDVSQIIVFDSDNVEDLRNKGLVYMHDNILPKAEYKVDFVKLAQSNEYKNLKILETIEVGDFIKIKNDFMKIDTNVKIVGIEKDILDDKNIRVDLKHWYDFV